MRDIEEVFSVVAPDPCGYGEFVDKKFRPICPTAHALQYQGENLEKLFKRKQENIVKKIAWTLGVLPEALYEFIAAWDSLRKCDVEPKLAFDMALTAAEKVEDAEEARQKALAELRIKANERPYANFLDRVTFPVNVNRYIHAYTIEFDEISKWQLKEVFDPTKE